MAAPSLPRLIRWTGLLFVIGSALFAVGVPLSFVAALPIEVSLVTFAVGAVFFTSAAFLQLLLARRELPESSRRVLRFWRGKTSDWTAAAIQLVGTLAFNITTIRSVVLVGADPSVANREVWVPDVVGSILFLVSSAIAMVPEVRARRHSHVRPRSWAIAALNLTGSVFFGLSAVGAYILTSTDQPISLRWANLGTFLGALCFLVGAALFGWPGTSAAVAAGTEGRATA